MHNPLSPNPDVDVKFQSAQFDDILSYFSPLAKDKNPKLEVHVQAAINGSDIKWNNMSGVLTFKVLDGDRVIPVAGCQIDCFTGNCGAKAIDHLYILLTGQLKPNDMIYKKILKVIESFLWHKANCGILVGSDTHRKDWSGTTLKLIQNYGEAYKVVPPVWNPNYTWSKQHTISLFYKDLNGEKYVDYWS